MHWSIHNPVYLCFCLKTPYWIYMVEALTLKSQPTHTWTKLIWYIIFSIRHITVFLCLGTLESTSLYAWRPFPDSEITNRNLKTNKHDTKWTMKRTPVHNIGVETRHHLALFCLIWEHVHQAAQHFLCSVHVPSDCEGACSVCWFEGYK